MEIKCIKSAARLLNIDCVNKRGLDLSKEVLLVSVGQRAAEVLAVKVEGKKKFYARPSLNRLCLHQTKRQNFFHLQL